MVAMPAADWRERGGRVFRAKVAEVLDSVLPVSWVPVTWVPVNWEMAYPVSAFERLPVWKPGSALSGSALSGSALSASALSASEGLGGVPPWAGHRLVVSPVQRFAPSIRIAGRRRSCQRALRRLPSNDNGN
ncbi:hypothetical protein RRSWK_01629 [Rhodopirellula sp. SWK7]|nr:hypothetical protein RRSWK_01629 [Rhodopirellula sp. SWK7]